MFLCQLADWEWQFGGLSNVCRARDELATAIREVQTSTKRLLNSFENLDKCESGSGGTLSDLFELRLYDKWPELLDCMDNSLYGPRQETGDRPLGIPHPLDGLRHQLTILLGAVHGLR